MGKKPQSGVKSHARDMCMTPLYALEPLVHNSERLHKAMRTGDKLTVFDPCAGTGNIVAALTPWFNTVGQDICGGTNYREYVRTYTRDDKGVVQLTSPIDHPEMDFTNPNCPMPTFDVIVTNPPWSQALKFVERALIIGKPFAMLVPTDFITTVGFYKLNQAQILTPWFSTIYMAPRVAFIMPDNPNAASANVPSMWFCYNMGLMHSPIFAYTDKTIKTLSIAL